MMLNAKDIETLKSRGADETLVNAQLENFCKGFPFLQLAGPATTGNGLKQLADTEIDELVGYYHDCIDKGLTVMKFVPASGAASRMFKSLFEAQDILKNNMAGEAVFTGEVKQFFSSLKRFAFYKSLMTVMPQKYNRSSVDSGFKQEGIDGNDYAVAILNHLLTEKGLNYGNMPKALLKFHSYGQSTRTAFAEHLVEGAMYARNHNGQVNIHFTISPEHSTAFNKHLLEIKENLEQTYEVSLNISFSYQKASTDTIAVTPDNLPFRDNDGNLLFRPGGHGALLENLNNSDADLVFIKNIDNVVPDYLKPETIRYKKALAGLLLKMQQKIFGYQHIFDTHHYYSLDSAFLAEAASFMENILNVKPPESQYYTEKEDLYHYLKARFDRPLRVCGMVRNLGEPGGGPFFVRNRDSSVSLHIVESSQVDLDNPIQKEIMNESTHFNPVDLICAFKNHKGEKYDLTRFRDPQTGFISTKYKDGRALKAQELPGLWNGAMADWNTIFVEVPITTFNPVKTVSDLLRQEHQPQTADSEK